MNFLARLIVNALALCAAAFLVDGINLAGIGPETVDIANNWVNIGIVALVFGLVNAVIKPIAKLLSFPFILVTLGLFTLVVNAGMLEVTDWLTKSLSVDGFVPALLGGVVITLVSTLLSTFLDDDKRKKAKRQAKPRPQRG